MVCHNWEQYGPCQAQQGLGQRKNACLFYPSFLLWIHLVHVNERFLKLSKCFWNWKKTYLIVLSYLFPSIIQFTGIPSSTWRYTVTRLIFAYLPRMRFSCIFIVNWTAFVALSWNRTAFYIRYRIDVFVLKHLVLIARHFVYVMCRYKNWNLELATSNKHMLSMLSLALAGRD